MNVKLLTEHRLEFLSLKGGCRDLSESTLVKMPHCWKSHATALLYSIEICINIYCRCERFDPWIFQEHILQKTGHEGKIYVL